MDTTSRKTEALYILKVIERGSADREFIGEARHQFYALMHLQGIERKPYLDSVDACLTLPMPSDLSYWNLHAYQNDPCTARLWYGFDAAGKGEASTLPIAMLKAWWSTQED